MATRSTSSTVHFLRPFTLTGYTDELPPGEYEVLVEEELLEGLSFAAYRRTATYLTVRGRGRMAGRAELRPINETDLETALGPDRKP
jgi:hypothetical protein